ncbi:MAG: divergent polysaccharide deacetylase family protein [Alphaproteobacteria bacterium]
MAKSRTSYGRNKKRRSFWKKLMLLLLLAFLAGGGYTGYIYLQERNFQKKTMAEAGISLFPSPKGKVANPRPIDIHGQPYTVTPQTSLISFVLLDLGTQPELSKQALEQLPAEITFAISPFIQDPAGWAKKAKELRHEILVNIPMEPDNYPANDPGPQTLLNNLPAEKNLERLAIGIENVGMSVGVTHASGSSFTTYEASMEPVLKALRQRGMLFLDTLMSPYSVASKLARKGGTSFLVANHFLGGNPGSIGQELKKIQMIAQYKGTVVAVAPLSPLALKEIIAWIKNLPKGFALAPLTAVMKATHHDAP